MAFGITTYQSMLYMLDRPNKASGNHNESARKTKKNSSENKNMILLHRAAPGNEEKRELIMLNELLIIHVEVPPAESTAMPPRPTCPAIRRGHQ